MSGKPFRVVSLDHTYGRSSFNSGLKPLDAYFKERVTQDIRRGITACFVALSGDGHIAGYYTLASASVFLGDLPAELTKKLPRYPSLPAVRVGHLAVDQAFRGQGLDSALLADALTRIVRSEIAAYALVVDAKDEKAASFYRHHRFLQLATKPLPLFSASGYGTSSNLEASVKVRLTPYGHHRGADDERRTDCTRDPPGQSRQRAS